MIRWRELDRTVGLPLLRLIVERLLLGPVPGLHRLARRLLGSRLEIIDPLIDRTFYARQLRPEWSRAAADRDPALHYHLVGRFHQSSPHPEFDPRAYRDAHPHLTWADDPLVDFGRTARGFRETGPKPDVLRTAAPTIVTLHHGRGGGSSHYLDLLEQRLRREGFAVVRLTRLSLTAPLYRAMDMTANVPRGPFFDLVAEPESLGDTLRAVGADRLVVNHTVDLPADALSLIVESCRRVGVPFEVHLHDYFYLCPRINLVDADGRPCDAPTDRACAGCVFAYPGRPPLARDAWRDVTHRFLGAASRRVAPSHDVASRYNRIWPDLRMTVRPPEDDDGLGPPCLRPRAPGRPLTVAVLGRLNVPKGFDVVLALAREIRRRRLPMRLVLIGQSIDDAALRRRGVLVHGRYRPEEAPRLLGHYAPDVVFIPSIWPETWSFVLSLALAARLPVAAFDLGAIAERLRRLGFGTLLPLDLADRPADLLAGLRDAALPGGAPASSGSTSSREIA